MQEGTQNTDCGLGHILWMDETNWNVTWAYEAVTFRTAQHMFSEYAHFSVANSLTSKVILLHTSLNIVSDCFLCTPLCLYHMGRILNKIRNACVLMTSTVLCRVFVRKSTKFRCGFILLCKSYNSSVLLQHVIRLSYTDCNRILDQHGASLCCERCHMRQSLYTYRRYFFS
jgi:hypothetical protein